MKSKLSKQKEEQQPATTPGLDIEAVLREKYTGQTAAPAAARNLPAIETKPVYKNAGAPPAERKKNLVRVSVDFPRPLYEAMVMETDERAQTLREFMLTLVRGYFEQKAGRAG